MRGRAEARTGTRNEGEGEDKKQRRVHWALERVGSCRGIKTDARHAIDRRERTSGRDNRAESRQGGVGVESADSEESFAFAAGAGAVCPGWLWCCLRCSSLAAFICLLRFFFLFYDLTVIPVLCFGLLLLFLLFVSHRISF